MKREIQILRLTAKVLLGAVPIVLLTGYLTAKPGFIGPQYYGTFRWLHSVAAPVLFIPLLLIHSLAGVLFLLSRNKRWNRPWLRRALMALWAVSLSLFAYLYWADPMTTAAAVAIVPDTLDGSAPAAEEARMGRAGAGAVAVSSASAGAGGATATGMPDEMGFAGQDAAAPAAAAVRRAPSGTATTRRAPSSARSAAAKTATAGSRSTSTAAATAAPLDGTRLIAQRCGGCHGLDQVYGRGRSSAEWQAVIQRMIGHGAQLSVDEQRAVMSRLPRAKP